MLGSYFRLWLGAKTGGGGGLKVWLCVQRWTAEVVNSWKMFTSNSNNRNLKKLRLQFPLPTDSHNQHFIYFIFITPWAIKNRGLFVLCSMYSYVCLNSESLSHQQQRSVPVSDLNLPPSPRPQFIFSPLCWDYFVSDCFKLRWSAMLATEFSLSLWGLLFFVLLSLFKVIRSPVKQNLKCSIYNHKCVVIAPVWVVVFLKVGCFFFSEQMWVLRTGPQKHLSWTSMSPLKP